MLRTISVSLGIALLCSAALAEMTITFIDAGQADAAVVQIDQASGEPITIVVDGGYNALEDNLPALLVGDPTIELVVLSHPHPEHVGGLNWLVSESNFVVQRVWWNEGFSDNDGFKSFLVGLLANGIMATKPEEAFHHFSFGSSGFTIRVLNDGQDFPDTRGHFQNNNSLVFQIIYEPIAGAPVTVLFTGDITEDQGEILVAQYGDELRSDIVKVPHHGSEKVFPEFAERVGARFAFVSSSGMDETPRKSGLDLYNVTAEIFCTCDAAGSISNLIVRVDDMGVISTTPRTQPPYFVWEEDLNGDLQQVIVTP